ncbi:MAG: flagellar protein FliS [Candidatus Coatesbacteria bacterium]|nr:flagellar protein FliS [Candidatus Coatesbacteria bacterium]
MTTLSDQMIAARALVNHADMADDVQQAVLAFYDGALEFAGLAKEFTEAGDIRESHKFRGKLLNVLSELMRSSFPGSGRKEADSFFLHSYMSEIVRRTIVEQQDASGFNEVLGVLAELRSSWERALANSMLANQTELVLAGR